MKYMNEYKLWCVIINFEKHPNDHIITHTRQNKKRGSVENLFNWFKQLPASKNIELETSI